MWKHWTARTNTPYEPFRFYKTARWVWRALPGVFPDALGAVLMPNHFHIILPSRVDLKKIHAFQGVISKKLKTPELWQPIQEPDVIPDRLHLRRIVRYAALNPCRAKLCADPLEWTWSTYRDVMGASAHSWIDDVRLAKAFGESTKGFRVRFHAYVSGDPSVSVDGTPPPQGALPKPMAEEGIREILFACAASLRVPPQEVEIKGSALRKYFIHLAYRQGWKHPLYLARICRMSRQAVHVVLKEKDTQKIEAGIEAAALCLGDRRLRTGFDVAQTSTSRAYPPGVKRLN